MYNFLFFTEEIHVHFRKYRINKILRVNHCQFFNHPNVIFCIYITIISTMFSHCKYL